MLNSIYAALLAVALTITTKYYIKTELKSYLLLFIFLSTFSVYIINNFFVQYRHFKNNITLFLQKYLIQFLILLFSLLIMIEIFFYFNLIEKIVLVMLIFLTSFYLIIYESIYSYKNIGLSFLKPVILALVWSMSTVILPVISDISKTIIFQVIIVFIIRFLLIAANGLLLDFYDQKKDAKFNISNIYLFYSNKNVLKVIAALLIVTILIIIYSCSLNFIWILIIGDLICALTYFTIIILYLNNIFLSWINSDFYPYLLDSFLFFSFFAVVLFYQ